jgi:putative mycofactocin binding protein MftB
MIDLDAPYELDPAVALRPEPFGALAYHFGNRRLTFLRSPDIVEVVRSLSDHASAAEALRAAGIESTRWPSFRRALDSLEGSDTIRRRDAA